METAEVTNDLGKIRIADRVIALIARDTAFKVPGIAGMGETFLHNIPFGIAANDTEGIHVGFKNGSVIIDLYVCAYHGDRIPAIALQLQEAVKESISDCLGIKVSAVNVNISGVVFEKGKIK